MTDLHPITPPPELFAQCYEEAERNLQVPFSLKFAMSHAIRTAYAAGHAAGALLAQPVAEGPSDEEIMELMPQQMREDLAAAARALAEQAGTDSRRAMGIMRIILNRHAVDHARAAIAKWGTND